MLLMRHRVGLVALCISAVSVFADETFDKLMQGGKYKEAIEYADQKIDAPSRTADIWVKLAQANEKVGLTEKALACYMVSWRMNPKSYDALVGAARIYNQLNQPEQARDMARKALDESFTAEASWEYARACIELGKPAEAKKALEKVIESDPSNAIANRELGHIYYDDKEYAKAAQLLEKSYQSQADAEVAYKIGKSYNEAGNASKAIEFLSMTVKSKPTMYEAGLDLARAYFAMNNHLAAANEYKRIAGKISFEASDYYNQALALEKTGKSDEAVAAYRKAVSEFGGSKKTDALEARLVVGKADLEKKSYAAAAAQFEFIERADTRREIAPNIYFLLADAYQGANNTSKAIASLEQAIELDGRNVEAYARLADLYEKSNQKSKAQATYEKMMSLSPNDPKVYLTLGQYRLKAGNYSEALELFVKSNSLSKSGAALEGIAISASKLGQWDKARDAAESAILIDKNLNEARIVLYDAYKRGGNYKEAAKHLEVLVSKHPAKLEYWEDLALCYNKLGRADQLAEADKKIVALDKKNAESRLRFAKYSLAKGDEATAYTLFKELAVLTPKNPEVFKTLYEISKGRKETASAISYLRKYLALNGRDAEAQRDLGDMLYERKDYDGALEAYEQAIKIDPAIKGFYKRYADIVIKKGQQDKVIKALTGVIRSGEADLNTYTTLGMIYQKKEVYNKAKEMYEKALRLDPQNIDALVALAECQTALGDVSGAVITYEQAVMMDPKAKEEHKALGDLYMKQKRPDQAIRSYVKFLDAGGEDNAVAARVGKHLYEDKKYEEALKYLSMVKGKDANDFVHLLMVSDASFHTGDYKRAISIIDGLKKRNPSLGTLKDILLTQARSYEKSKMPMQAAETYDEYVKLRGVKDADAAYKRAYLREEANPSLAQDIYESNIRSYPEDSRNYLRLGLLYTRNKETLPKAARMLEKAAASVKGADSVWLEIAQVYNQLGKEDKELEAYQKFITGNPQDLKANIRLGTLLMKKGKITEGMVHLETANTIAPNNPEVMELLAKGYVKTRRPQEAISLLEKAKELKPQDVTIRKVLVDLYRKSGDLKRARREVEELVKVKHDNSFLLMYAEILYEDGKYKDVEDVVEDIRATDPENVDALMLLAKAQRARKKWNDAIETYKEIIYINADYVPAIYGRAEVYLEQGKPQWALKFFERAQRADPTFARAYLGLAMVAKLRKDQSTYQTQLKKAYSLDKNDPLIAREYQKAF